MRRDTRVLAHHACEVSRSPSGVPHPCSGALRGRPPAWLVADAFVERQRLRDHLIHVVVAIRGETAAEMHVRRALGECLVLPVHRRVLGRSAAQVYGPAAIGVILTGNLDDGTAGLWTLKQMGGVAVVQDVHDAMFPSMPAHGAKDVDIDYSVPLSQMAKLLEQLVNRAPDTTERVVPLATRVEIDIAKGANPRDAGFEEMAMPSRFACPECHGVLLEVKEGGRIRFRCHTGHAYSPASLLADIDQGIRTAMGVSLRALEEGIILLDQLTAHVQETHTDHDLTSLLSVSGRAREQSQVLRQLIDDWQPLPAVELP